MLPWTRQAFSLSGPAPRSLAVKASRTAHREMLQALFVGIFGECRHVVTSRELRQAGFDDSHEPDITDYREYV